MDMPDDIVGRALSLYSVLPTKMGSASSGKTEKLHIKTTLRMKVLFTC